jgi:hypothetical protein
MAEIMKEKAGIKGNNHEEKEGKETPGSVTRWSKWKTLAGALIVATTVGTGQAGCGNNDPGNTNINIPSDGGCATDGGCEAGAGGDGGTGGVVDSGTGGTTDSGTGGMNDGGAAGMDGGAAGMDGGATDGGAGGDGGAVSDGGAAGMDGGSDSGPVACVSASTGQFVGTIGTAPRTVGGYVLSYEGPSGSDAVFSITCGGEAVQTDYHCPVGITSEINVPVDGKKISITPWSAAATTTSCQVKVENL